MIECEDGSLYTGIAVDVHARYEKHVSGKGARYTRSHKPRSLLMAQPFPDRSSASRAEYQLKQLPAEEKRCAAGAAMGHQIGALAATRFMLKPADGPRERRAGLSDR